MRGVVKSFFPYFVEAAYIRHKYGVDPVPKWYKRERILSRMLFAAVQVLPYGLIGPSSVVVPPPPVSLPVQANLLPGADRSLPNNSPSLTVNKRTPASAKKTTPQGFSISPISFEIFKETSLSEELIQDIHVRVIEGLYPEVENEIT